MKAPGARRPGEPSALMSVLTVAAGLAVLVFLGGHRPLTPIESWVVVVGLVAWAAMIALGVVHLWRWEDEQYDIEKWEDEFSDDD